MSTEDSPGLASDPADAKPILALIAGPTASGKSDLGVEFARCLERTGRKAAIVNADSAQAYRDLRVLSARPTEEEMGGIEHFLFGDWDGATPCSAADWASAAKTQIARLHKAGAIPVLVGGTGLYLRTLLDGIAPIPEIDPDIRQEVRSLETETAFAALGSEDPERAAQLAPADSQRIARALEVVRSTGQPLSYWQARLEGGIGTEVNLKAAILLPERDELYRRCDARFEKMLQCGAMEEVEALLARNLDPDLPVVRAIGVPEIRDYLRGVIPMDELIARGSQATRNYAKRQYTWFRRQPPSDWLRLEYEDFSREALKERLLHRWRLT